MRYPHPALYLSGISDYLRRHLFADVDDLLVVLRNFHPGVRVEDIDAWRFLYRESAPDEDRHKVPMMEEERDAIARMVERLDERETPQRAYRKFFDRFLFRPDYSRSRAITAATTVPVGEARAAWSLQEDTQVLDNLVVRGETPDVQRRALLRNTLAVRPLDIPREDDHGPDLLERDDLPDEEPDTITPDPPQDAPQNAPQDADDIPAPAAVIGVGNGVKAVVQDDLQKAFIELGGHGGVTYTKEQVATAISRLVMVHDLMEDDQ